MDPSARRAALETVVKGIEDTRVKRTLQWIEQLQTQLEDLIRIIDEPEGSRVSRFVRYAAERADLRRMPSAAYFLLPPYGAEPAGAVDFGPRTRVEGRVIRAVVGSLRGIGFPGEAANINILCKRLTKHIREVSLRLFDPSRKPLDDDLRRRVLLILLRAAELQKALFEAEVLVVHDDARKRLPRKAGQGVKPAAGSDAAGGADGETAAPSAPAVLLASWREILITLGMKNNREDRQKVDRLNTTYGGPIKKSGQGRQPLVDKAKLIEWWNHLEATAQSDNRRRDATATVAARHKYARDGEAVPDISGGVKRRRKDRRA